MGGEVSVKLPFTLTHSCINEAPTDSVTEEATHKMILEGKEKEEVKDKQNNSGETIKEADEPSPENHRCIADVLVNIENQMTRAKVAEQREMPAVKSNNEELDLIEKYHETDT